MFDYVPRREVAEYKACCSDVLNRLKMKLEKEYDIRAYVTLIGSGAQNMVTRDGKGPFDLDYNLVLTSVPQENEKSLKRLKNLIRKILDDLVDKRFKPGKDSTSSITYLAHAKDGKTVVFSFDVALIREKGGQSKLVHDKEKDIFIWNYDQKGRTLEGCEGGLSGTEKYIFKKGRPEPSVLHSVYPGCKPGLSCHEKAELTGCRKYSLKVRDCLVAYLLSKIFVERDKWYPKMEE